RSKFNMSTSILRLISVFLFSAPLVGQSVLNLTRHSILGAAVKDADQGLQVTWTKPSGAADRAGIRVGDVITSIDGEGVQGSAEFVLRVKRLRAGRVVVFQVHRGGEVLSLKVTLEVAPDEKDPLVTTYYQAIVVD